MLSKVEKAYYLWIRYLVPVCPKQIDTAHDILQELGANEDTLRKSQELYNLDVANRQSIFFNETQYDLPFFGDQDCSIEVPRTQEELAIEDSQTQNPVESIDQKRATQISKVLELIESRLREARGQRERLERRVEYCRTCCYQEPDQEESTAQPEEEDEDIPEDASQKSASSESSEASILPVKQQEADDSSVETEDIDAATIFSEESSKSPSLSIESDLDYVYSDGDVVTKIKSYLMDTCTCPENMYVEDLHELEKELEAVTGDELFYGSIANNLKTKLEKHQKRIQNGGRAKTKKVLVDYVLSWNNESYCTRMLKHSFLHRKSEYMVNFQVADVVGGSRSKFGGPGEKERNSTDFLSACSKADKKAIYEHIEKNGVDVNVCDAKGNNGVFFAAKHNHLDVLKILVNLGAKIDQENDESLLPLSMCLLKVLAKKHDVENWEKSFLPESEPSEELEERYKWKSNMSVLKIPSSRRPTIQSKVSAKASVKSTKTYLFDTSFVILKKNASPPNIPIQRKTSFGIPFATSQKSVENTIMTLLQLGANPNSGNAPLPILFLSLFTEDPSIVENVLQAGADVQITLEDDQTCLHVIASSKCTRTNVCICHLLISYNCDARLKTSTNHWDRQKLKILGKGVDPDSVEDSGKNALHILSVREDFVLDHCSYFQDMVMNFTDSNINFNERYLGHTPLSLAVLIGNKMLVEVFLSQHLVDPYQVLDYSMGNVLTVYILRRYEDIVPPNAQEILDCMVDLGVNVLHPVGEFDNAIDFMVEEQKVVEESTKKPSGKLNKKAAQQRIMMEYMVDLARETIIRCIQLLVVENLYNLIEDDLAQHRSVSILAEYLTPASVISNLQLVFNHGIIHPERFDKSTCLQLIDIVKAVIRRRSKAKPKPDQEAVTDATDYGYILNMMDFSKSKRRKSRPKLQPPGLDDISKYVVCFHCLQKRNKRLLVCPKCQLLYFCSTSCNKENLKLGLHPCNNNFYQSEQARLRPTPHLAELENLAELFSRVRENCENRRLEKLYKNLELERKKVEEERRLDKYGTRVLRKAKLGTVHVSPTLNSLMGSPRSFCTSTEECNLVPSKTTRFGSVCPKNRSDGKLASLLSRFKICREQDFDCGCRECIGEGKGTRVKCKCPSSRKKTRPKIDVDKDAKDTTVVVHKLRAIPQKCQEFLKLLKDNCPDLDFSSMLLPYACYSNGHLYYKFLEGNRGRTYSMV